MASVVQGLQYNALLQCNNTNAYCSGTLTSQNVQHHALHRIISYGVQAAWRLGNWDLLKDFCARLPDPSDFEGSFGKILLHMRQGNEAALLTALANCRVDLMVRKEILNEVNYCARLL